MINQNDVIDQLFIRPIKKVKDKKTIPAQNVFEGIKTKKKIKLPKSYDEKLNELKNNTTLKKKK